MEALDGTCQNWGQGVNFDEENRPIGAVSYQENTETIRRILSEQMKRRFI